MRGDRYSSGRQKRPFIYGISLTEFDKRTLGIPEEEDDGFEDELSQINQGLRHLELERLRLEQEELARRIECLGQEREVPKPQRRRLGPFDIPRDMFLP